MTAPRAAILGCAGPALSPAERAFLRDADPWGFILFARNVENVAQLRRLTAGLREAVGREAPILIDQEGGRVARLRPPQWRGWPPPPALADILSGDDLAEALSLRARLIAFELREIGADANCVPMADVAAPGADPIIASRALGTEPAEVARLARAIAEATLAGGVLPVLKHLPGHGRAAADSHLTLPVVDAPRETLRATDFVPFRELADLPLAMTAHVVFSALDPESPATLSPACIAAIREDIGFSGLLMSDDLGMGALSGAFRDRAAAALAAGCDIVLHCSGERAEMADLLAAVPRLAGEAAARAAAALAARRPQTPFDVAAADARHAELTEAVHA